MSEQKTTDMSQHFYRASAADFMKVPGSPVAYWLSKKALTAFKKSQDIRDTALAAVGLQTGDNDTFIRYWYEVNFKRISFNTKSCQETKSNGFKWYPYNKGGLYRKWYGNQDFIVNWENDGELIRNFKDSNGKLRSRPQNTNCYFKRSISWSDVTSGNTSFRYFEDGFIYDVTGMSAQSNTDEELKKTLAFCNSKIVNWVIKSLNPTLHFQIGNYHSLPYLKETADNINIKNINRCIDITKKDSSAYESSFDFKKHQLTLESDHLLKTNYFKIKNTLLSNVIELKKLETENNRIFIEAYGLQDELTPEVPLKEITLTCNPHYRYGGDLTDQEREDRLQSETIAELLSYAIGCMMGRYSLDREGLVYAHAGNEGFADLVAEDAYKTFAADDDGILPLTEQEWFSDDVTNRISEFVHTVWGEQHLEENLQFIADSLCLYALKAKKGERALDTIRRYLSNQFYKDHLKTYKRRPIYWLFSSGKHKAFECLVYLHRYHEGTLARMRTEYVIPLSSRINARINRLHEEVEAASSTSERKQLMTELKTLHNQQAELASFDEQLRHHADMRIPLDLDDGVKENYGKFGNLLDSVKAVTGKNND